MKIYDLVLHPSDPTVVRVGCDFDARTTELVRYDLTAKGLVETGSAVVEGLLRDPDPADDGFVVWAMPVREWGAPVLMQRVDWDLKVAESVEIRRPKLGLMRGAYDRRRNLAILDRSFPESGFGDALVLGSETLAGFAETTAEVGGVPLVSHMPCAAFEKNGVRVAVMHTDQGGAEVHVLAVLDEGAVGGGVQLGKLTELASAQILDDACVGSLHFWGNEIVVVSVDTYVTDTKVGVYDLGGEGARFVCELQTGIDWDQLAEEGLSLDEEEVSMQLGNGRTVSAHRDDVLWVGGFRSVVAVDLYSGKTTDKHDVPVKGFVSHVIAAEGVLVAMDTLGQLEVVRS